MPQILPISVFIIAQNEADRIAITINSVKDWVQEIIVIDSGSTDDTVAIASSHGARVLYNKWAGYGLQKRFGEEQCQNNWLINLDADEEISHDLAQEIKGLFKDSEPNVAGFIVPVLDIFPREKKISHFAHNNPCLRLYDKRKGRFSDSPVHDSVIINEGLILKLKNPIIHRSFRNISHAIEKLNSYGNAQAKNLRKGKLKFLTIRLLLEFPVSFIKAYFLRLYMLRGWEGFVYAIIYAFSRFIRLAKYKEIL